MKISNQMELPGKLSNFDNFLKLFEYYINLKMRDKFSFHLRHFEIIGENCVVTLIFLNLLWKTLYNVLPLSNSTWFSIFEYLKLKSGKVMWKLFIKKDQKILSHLDVLSKFFPWGPFVRTLSNPFFYSNNWDI